MSNDPKPLISREVLEKLADALDKHAKYEGAYNYSTSYEPLRAEVIARLKAYRAALHPAVAIPPILRTKAEVDTDIADVLREDVSKGQFLDCLTLNTETGHALRTLCAEPTNELSRRRASDEAGNEVLLKKCADLEVCIRALRADNSSTAFSRNAWANKCENLETELRALKASSPHQAGEADAKLILQLQVENRQLRSDYRSMTHSRDRHECIAKAAETKASQFEIQLGACHQVIANRDQQIAEQATYRDKLANKLTAVRCAVSNLCAGIEAVADRCRSGKTRFNAGLELLNLCQAYKTAIEKA